MARAAGKGEKEIGRVLKARAAALAFAAALAWLANWSVHAAMALERPLGLYGPVCGTPSAPSPLAACPVCEDSLAAGAGPLAVLEAPGLRVFPDQQISAREDGEAPKQRGFADAPARAPPPA